MATPIPGVTTPFMSPGPSPDPEPNIIISKYHSILAIGLIPRTPHEKAALEVSLNGFNSKSTGSYSKLGTVDCKHHKMSVIFVVLNESAQMRDNITGSHTHSYKIGEGKLAFVAIVQVLKVASKWTLG